MGVNGRCSSSTPQTVASSTSRTRQPASVKAAVTACSMSSRHATARACPSGDRFWLRGGSGRRTGPSPAPATTRTTTPTARRRTARTIPSPLRSALRWPPPSRRSGCCWACGSESCSSTSTPPRPVSTDMRRAVGPKAAAHIAQPRALMVALSNRLSAGPRNGAAVPGVRAARGRGPRDERSLPVGVGVEPADYDGGADGFDLGQVDDVGVGSSGDHATVGAAGSRERDTRRIGCRVRGVEGRRQSSDRSFLSKGYRHG